MLVGRFPGNSKAPAFRHFFLKSHQIPSRIQNSESYPIPRILQGKMGRQWFLRFLLVSSLLALFFSHGCGRKLMETAEHGEDSSVLVSKENHRKSRKMIKVMDYADPEPNVNPRTGYIFTPPPQPN